VLVVLFECACGVALVGETRNAYRISVDDREGDQGITLR
jgi:hypothetical protein